jgi:putative PIN family toxin of toxin-antitoxin system
VRIVLDTNILVSALNFNGRERELLELARIQAYDLYLSPFILAELSGVLIHKFAWDETRAEQALELVGSWATIVDPQARVSAIRRNDADNRILECAVEAGADYLVTGDRRDLLPLKEYEGVRIVTAAEFIATLTRP